MQSPSGIHQENPIAPASIFAPDLATPVFQPTPGFFGPTPLNWNGPQVVLFSLTILDNASLIRELADAKTSQKNELCQN